MIRSSKFACLAVSLGLSLACNQRPDIEAETRDLAEARNNTGNVVKDLETRLDKAKAEVVELEKKLALAREGVTDDVIKERAELEGALNAQRQEVQKDINEARRESEVLNKNSDRAMQQLEETQPPAQVDARLKTETDVVRGTQQQVEAPARNEIVPVRGGPEEQPSQNAPEVKSTTSTTRSAPTQPQAPSSARPQDTAPQNTAPQNTPAEGPGVPVPRNPDAPAP